MQQFEAQTDILNFRPHPRVLTMSTVGMVVLPAAFAMLTAAQDIFKLPFLIAVRMLVMVLSFLVTDTKDMRRLYMFMLALSSDVVLYWLNVCFAVIYLSKGSRSIKITQSLFAMLVLLLWEMLHLFTVLTTNLGYLHILKQFGFALIFVAFILFAQKTDVLDEFPGIFRYWTAGVLSACVVLYIKYVIRVGPHRALSLFVGMGINSDSDLYLITYRVHPNLLSKFCGITFAMLVAILVSNRRFKLGFNTALIVISIPLILFFGVMTVAMSFYLMLVISVILIAICVWHDLDAASSIVSSLFIVGAAASAVAAIRSIIPNIGFVLIRDLLVADISNGRFAIWGAYWKMFLDYPLVLLFGVGLQDYFRKLTLWFGDPFIMSHNIAIEIIAAWGIIGAVAFCVFLYTFVREMRGKTLAPAPWLSYVPGLVFLFVSMTGNFLYGYNFNFSFVLIVTMFGVYLAKRNEQMLIANGDITI